ncbi:cytochrome c1 [Neisseria sp. Ec49-e6-T10]|uniref:cytochrome c1 n=1 Tax=Neisseria sp. Ec49-e6-T10 TaxID=3140744 RepID=UPI003EB6C261
MKNILKALLLACTLSSGVTIAADAVQYEKVDIDLGDQASLQRGAQTFVNYCLTCHSASAMRYNRLTDLGLTESDIEKNLMFTTDKVGDTMVSSMSKADAVAWFGAAPPDLSLIARSRGADYLYAYLRGFYKDPSRPTGWNNTVFDKVGMPHALWELQGIQEVELDEKGLPVMDEHGKPKLKWVSAGLRSTMDSNGQVDTAEYDAYAKDLVAYLVYMGEPAQIKRHQIGYLVLLFLFIVLLPLTYFLNKEYWKGIH